MTSNDMVRRSPEELMAFIIARFEHAGDMLEETLPSPGGQLLRFRQKSMKYVAYGVSNGSIRSSFRRDLCRSGGKSNGCEWIYHPHAAVFFCGAEKESGSVGMDMCWLMARPWDDGFSEPVH